MNTTPHEIDEQAMLVRWMDEYGIKIFSATAQSTFTGWAGIKKNQKAGVRKGVPDMIICLPASITKDKKNRLCFIEMKRLKGSTTSKEQKAWIDFINSVDGDVKAVIKKGGQEAIDYIKSLIIPKDESRRDITKEAWWVDQ